MSGLPKNSQEGHGRPGVRKGCLERGQPPRPRSGHGLRAWDRTVCSPGLTARPETHRISHAGRDNTQAQRDWNILPEGVR